MLAWQEYRLKHLVRAVVDKVSSDEELGPFVGLEAITPWTGIIDLEQSEESGDSVGNRFKPGDVLFGKLRPYLAKVAAPNFGGHCSSEALVLRPSLSIDTRFLRYRMVEAGTIDAMNASTYGAKMPRASWQFIGNLRLEIPTLETQKSIADFLDRETARIDQLIEKKERLIEVLKIAHKSETLREMRRGFDRLDYDSDTNRVDFSGLRSGWKRMRIKQVVSHMTSGSRAWGDQIQDEGELFLQSGCITTLMGVSIEGAPRVAPQRGAEANRTRVKTKDVIVCITGGRTGAVGFVSEIGETAYINQHVCLIRPNPKKVIPKLLAQVLFSEIGQLQFRMAQYGLKQGLGFAEVANVVIPCPALELQASICSAIDAASRRLESTTARVLLSIERVREFRSALITAAVTGQIDVNTWSRRGSTDRRLDQIEEEMRA